MYNVCPHKAFWSYLIAWIKGCKRAFAGKEIGYATTGVSSYVLLTTFFLRRRFLFCLGSSSSNCLRWTSFAS